MTIHVVDIVCSTKSRTLVARMETHLPAANTWDIDYLGNGIVLFCFTKYPRSAKENNCTSNTSNRVLYETTNHVTFTHMPLMLML